MACSTKARSEVSSGSKPCRSPRPMRCSPSRLSASVRTSCVVAARPEFLHRSPERTGARGRWPQATAGEMSGSEGVNVTKVEDWGPGCTVSSSSLPPCASCLRESSQVPGPRLGRQEADIALTKAERSRRGNGLRFCPDHRSAGARGTGNCPAGQYPENTPSSTLRVFVNEIGY